MGKRTRRNDRGRTGIELFVDLEGTSSSGSRANGATRDGALAYQTSLESSGSSLCLLYLSHGEPLR